MPTAAARAMTAQRASRRVVRMRGAPGEARSNRAKPRGVHGARPARCRYTVNTTAAKLVVPSRLMARFTTAQTKRVRPIASESRPAESAARGTNARASPMVAEVAAVDTAASASAHPAIHAKSAAR